MNPKIFLSQFLGTNLDMLFEMVKSVEILIILGKNGYFTLKFLISCKNIIVLIGNSLAS